VSEQVSQSENALTVSTLAALLTQALTEFFPQAVTLDAEITNFKTYPSGHWYFSLTDGDASLSARDVQGCQSVSPPCRTRRTQSTCSLRSEFLSAERTTPVNCEAHDRSWSR
jgi:hypothetical protein